MRSAPEPSPAPCTPALHSAARQTPSTHTPALICSGSDVQRTSHTPPCSCSRTLQSGLRGRRWRWTEGIRRNEFRCGLVDLGLGDCPYRNSYLQEPVAVFSRRIFRFVVCVGIFYGGESCIRNFAY